MTNLLSSGEERLQRLAAPEKDIASGTRTLVVGPYVTRRRRRSEEGAAASHGTNPRPPKARLGEAVGLAGAIDLQVVGSVMVFLAALRPATYLGKGKVEELAES